METNKSTITIISLIIAATTLSLIFWDEYYVTGVLVVSIIIFILFNYYRKKNSKPIEYKSVEYDLTIVDTKGEKATLIEKSEIIIREKNVDKIISDGFTTSGRIEPQKCNIGKLEPPIDEGGIYTVITTLRNPLKKGETYEHIIEVDYIDTFLGDKETFSITPKHIRERFVLYLTFPSNKPFKTIEAYLIKEGRYMDTVNPISFNNNHKIKFAVENPDQSTSYVLAWTW